MRDKTHLFGFGLKFVDFSFYLVFISSSDVKFILNASRFYMWTL
jgi:hypothetical protein